MLRCKESRWVSSDKSRDSAFKRFVASPHVLPLVYTLNYGVLAVDMLLFYFFLNLSFRFATNSLATAQHSTTHEMILNFAASAVGAVTSQP